MSGIREGGIVVPADWVPLRIELSDDVRSWSKSTSAELRDRSKAAGYDLENIAHANLPIGPAVRVRQNFAAVTHSRRDPGILMETLTYGALPTGSESALMLLMSWTVPGLSKEMEETADSIAETLTVDLH
ncbi:hypothetical protein [Streptomyces tendae]|uniref:hypothetical protein n=1 Tax=Streptomyces tendae TaxID=1932 RepID=UPI002493015B|nr:hypothetical protein [Streptomyces tendae]